MAVTDWADFRDKIGSPFQETPIHKNSLTINASGLSTWSYWLTGPYGGSAPTTAAVPTNTTAGAIKDYAGSNLRADAANAMYLAGYGMTRGAGTHGALILIDRLSHQGGLDATVTTAGVTTNLPTSALTRYTTGAGVMAGIEIYTQIGTTATTITCAYTDQSGNGSTSQPSVIGGTGNREVGRFIPINLEAGDTGVRAITSSTLLATTGTAGAFGYVLYKPLMIIPTIPGTNVIVDAILGGGGNIPEISDNACLSWLFWNGAAAGSTNIVQGKLTFIDS